MPSLTPASAGALTLLPTRSNRGLPCSETLACSELLACTDLDSLALAANVPGSLTLTGI